jgi:AcrR family transcriptional regulator
VISAARALFAERGFEATTVDDIVRVADVAKGTFYYHFQTKEELVVVMSRLQLGEVVRAMDARLDAGEPPLAALRLLMAGTAAGAEASRELAYVFLAASFRQPTPQDTELPSFRRAAARALAAAQAAGQVRGDVEPAELGGMLGMLVAAAEIAWLASDDGEPLVAGVERALTIFLEGAAAR